jgi:hypothetical protein
MTLCALGFFQPISRLDPDLPDRDEKAGLQRDAIGSQSNALKWCRKETGCEEDYHCYDKA